MLGDQESPTGFTPSLIAYIHASSIKIVSLLILSSVPSIMYLAGVKAGLEEWRASVGLPEIVNDIADFLDRVAGRLGIPRRADLGHTPCTPQALFEDFIPEWCRLQDRLYTAYQRGLEVMDATEVYVQNELRQPWPWLAYRLAHHVFQQAWERAMGITLVHQMASYLDDHIWGPWVQPFRFVFETIPGEPLTKARQRLMSEAHKAARNLQPDDATKSSSLSKGSPQKKQEDNARRGAKWLYSHLICGEIQYQLAKSYHHERTMATTHIHRFSNSCGCLQYVRRSMNQAKDLLDSTPFIFGDSDK